MSGKSTFGSVVLWIVVMVAFKIWGVPFLAQFDPVPPKAEQEDDFLDKLHKRHLNSLTPTTSTTGTSGNWTSGLVGRSSRTSDFR